MATADETASPPEVVFNVKSNSRGMTEISVLGKHVSVEGLKKHILEDSTIWTKVQQLGQTGINKLMSRDYPEKPKILDYLVKDMPAYPAPVEFHVSSVAHATDERPLRMILESERFKAPNSSPVSWWSLNIQEEEINSAEGRYMQKIFPNQPQEQSEGHELFLHKFTNSPAFQPESRYGNYRFVFPLAELMELYQEQHCGGEEPVLRVMSTMFYKQEILYSVLVHSPEDDQRVRSEFGELPLLEDSEFASYQDGNIIWHAQAVSDALQFSLSVNMEEARVEVQPLANSIFYVWDHASLAFYLPDTRKALEVPRRRLIEAVEACKLPKINLLQPRCTTPEERERKFARAKQVVDDLKKELADEAEHDKTVLRN